MNPPSRPGSALRRTAVLALSLWTAAVPVAAASTPAAPPDTAAIPASPTLDPLELTDGIRTWVDQRVDRQQSRLVRLHALMDALFDEDDGLGVTYGNAGTRTAAGTFEVATGNCLSFTLLFVALARHVGLDAHFVEVAEVVGWSQNGPTSFAHWHIYAEVEVDNAIQLVDFLPVQERRYFQRRRIDEARVRAHFHNNVGAETLVAGDADRAIAHLETALALDPTFSPASVNLGVALRRSGSSGEAEGVFRRVLADDPRNHQAATNLARLLEDDGRHEEARPFFQQARAYLEKNPFHHFRLGVAALDAGDPATAVEHLEAAIRRRPQESMFHERLATALVSTGEGKRAASALEKAIARSDDFERRNRLRERLEQLRSGEAEAEAGE